MKKCDESSVLHCGKTLGRRVAFLIGVFLLSMITACQPQSVTMDLEGMTLNAGGQAMIQAMEEYQASALETYSYPALGPWIDINRTVCIQGADDDEVVVFTMDEQEELEWRMVQYAYPFYESRLLAEGSEAGEEPLVVAPLIVSPDGLAVAYQSLHSKGRFLEIAEVGKPTVLIGSDGQVYSTDPDLKEKEEISWDLVKADWSSDGRYLLFYRTNDWNIKVDESGVDLEFDVEEEETDSTENKGVVLTIKDIYGYDRQTCQVRKVWKAMRLNIPASKVPDYEVVVDVGEDGAAMFLLFDDKADCPDVKIWNQQGVMELETVKLPENPCIQMDTSRGIYYYQEAGDIWKASLSKNGQPQRILSAGSQLQAFLISEDAHRIFTIESREETEDVCLYLQDEKGSWYRQVIAVGTQGACSLQLSDDQQRLLVECRSEDENRAVVIYFGQQ